MWLTHRHSANYTLISTNRKPGGGSSAAMSRRVLWIDISRTIALLAGMAFAKLVPITRFDIPMKPGRLANALAWPGRHSLAIYLLHQPILLTVIWLALAIV